MNFKLSNWKSVITHLCVKQLGKDKNRSNEKCIRYSTYDHIVAMIRISSVKLLAHIKPAAEMSFGFFVQFATNPIPMDGNNPYFL